MRVKTAAGPLVLCMTVYMLAVSSEAAQAVSFEIEHPRQGSTLAVDDATVRVAARQDPGGAS